MDLEGTRDDSFGNTGRLTPGPGVNIMNINKARSGALDISANVFDRNICPSIIYDRFRYDASTGEAEDSFVSNLGLARCHSDTQTDDCRSSSD